MADKVIEAKTPGASPADLLKQAVTGKGGGPEQAKTVGPEQAKAVADVVQPRFGAMARGWAVPSLALAVGALIGGGVVTLAAPRQNQAAEALGQLQSAIEASRAETTRLNGEIERIGRGVTGLRDAGEASRKDAATRGGAVIERIAKVEAALSAKVAGLGDRQEQIEREQASRLAAVTAQIEKRATNSAPAPQAAKQPEPAQTGTISDTKTKPATIDGWALREVYDGIATLEDRKRRLVEVGKGDTVPGVGRVDTIERRGRAWVVVTKQGLITPQTW